MLTDIADVPPQQQPGPDLSDPGTHHHSPFHPVAVFRRLRQDTVALFGLCLVAFFILVAVFAPLLAPYDPRVTDTSRMNEAPFWTKAGANIKPGASRHLFGLDVAGRDILSRVIYGDHPAGLVSPPIDSVKKTTAEDLARFHSTHYVPNNALLAVVGDVTLKELLPKIEREFGDWKRGDVPKVEVPAAPSQPEARIHLIDRPGSVQTVLQLGNLAIERTSPDYFSVLVMDKIVGGGPAARLFMNLREDKGYTYGAYSFFGGYKYRGTWQASSNVRTEVTDPAIQKIADEAAKTSRIGARALKSVYGRIIKPFEFDPFSREEVQPSGEKHRLVLDEKLVLEGLKPSS